MTMALYAVNAECVREKVWQCYIWAGKIVMSQYRARRMCSSRLSVVFMAWNFLIKRWWFLHNLIKIKSPWCYEGAKNKFLVKCWTIFQHLMIFFLSLAVKLKKYFKLKFSNKHALKQSHSIIIVMTANEQREMKSVFWLKIKIYSHIRNIPCTMRKFKIGKPTNFKSMYKPPINSSLLLP